nr:PREDICTED: uncharacterized protein LOC103279761 isoform X3 [Anolis carolinensis]|eukprot:XP_016851277.1 PREDICTED: uncharacterized protein LOC103279761 isoform X3 [Anolis carolinensis]
MLRTGWRNAALQLIPFLRASLLIWPVDPAAIEPALKMILAWEPKQCFFSTKAELSLGSQKIADGLLSILIWIIAWLPVPSRVAQTRLPPGRFKQVQTLAVTADALFCLYSYVSKTPVQKISPAKLFWDFPEIPESWNAPSNPDTLSPLQRLQRAVSRMCLYISPQKRRLSGASDTQVPMSCLEQIVQEVMAKAFKDRLDRIHIVAPEDPTKMESASSKSVMMDLTPVAPACFCCEGPAQSKEKIDLILLGLQPWLASSTDGTNRESPDIDGYQEFVHHLSPPPEESSKESDEESSESTEKGSSGKKVWTS